MASYLLDHKIIQIIIQKLNNLVEYVKNNSEYYKCKYSNENYYVKEYKDIKRIPYVIREELQEYYPYGHLCVALAEVEAYFETTGSTGNPLSVLPDMSMIKASKFGEFINYWMNLQNDKINLAIVALPYEMNPMGLKYHYSLVSQGVTVIPASVRTTLCPPRKVIKLIKDLRPQLLVGRPLEIMRYAEAMEYMGMSADCCSIRKIFLTGETMSDAKWKRINNLYGGIDIYSTYGLTELDTGLISCEEHNYHLPNASNIIVEVVDEYGNDVQEGEMGNIIMTNLEKNFSPLIRYKTGDCGKYYKQCSCGMNTPYIKIYGRKVDEYEIDGVRVFPLDIEQILLESEELGCEYQLVVDNGELKIKAEKNLKSTKNTILLEKEIVERIHKVLGISCTVNVVEFNKLSDKFGIAKTKGCRFVDITEMDEETRERALKINVCDGKDLL